MQGRRDEGAADLLVSHVHVVVAKWHGDWQAATGVDSTEQHVSSSVARFLPRHGHAHHGGHSLRPRQQDGTGVRDDDDNIPAHFAHGVN